MVYYVKIIYQILMKALQERNASKDKNSAMLRSTILLLTILTLTSALYLLTSSEQKRKTLNDAIEAKVVQHFPPSKKNYKAMMEAYKRKRRMPKALREKLQEENEHKEKLNQEKLAEEKVREEFDKLLEGRHKPRRRNAFEQAILHQKMLRLDPEWVKMRKMRGGKKHVSIYTFTPVKHFLSINNK